MRLIYIIILILLSSAVVADNYTELGNRNDFYLSETGYFNTALETTVNYGRSADKKFYPTVADFDGDGTMEILVWDSTTMTLYENRTLDTLLGYTDQCGTPVYSSNYIVFDIDKDGKQEIIYSCLDEADETIEIIEYNTTSFYRQASLTWDTGNIHQDEGPGFVMCGEDGPANVCGMVYTRWNQVASSNPSIYIVPFNYTDSEESVLRVYSFDGVSSISCPPIIASYDYEDYDYDAVNEFVFGFATAFTDTDVIYPFIYVVYIQQNLTAYVEMTKYPTTVSIASAPGDFCNVSNYGRYMSAPTFYDIHASTGKEIIMASHYDADEFKMYSFKSDGNLLDDYPETYQADGILISNIMVGDIFPDTGREDFCVLGFASDDEEIDLICASEATSDVPETREFKWSTAGTYNVTSSWDNTAILSHTTRQVQTFTEGNNLDEIVNTYGIFEVVWGDVYEFQVGASVYTLNQIFDNPVSESTVIMTDYEELGRTDMIAQTATNIWYIDDGFTNSPGEIDGYCINPCLDATWKLNTTVSVQVTVVDTDDDLVSANSTLYVSDNNQQTVNWTNNASSGTTFSFSFIANKTTSSSLLHLNGRDDENFDEVDNIELYFSVANQGVEFGDCSTCVDGLSEGGDGEAGDACNTDADCETGLTCINGTCTSLVIDTLPDPGNSFDQFIGDFEENTGLGSAVIWLLFMAVLAIAIFAYNQYGNVDSNVTFFVVGIVEVCMLIIGVLLGYIGYGVLWAIIMIGVLAVAPWVTSKVIGWRQNAR